jgi:hypothetical protein
MISTSSEMSRWWESQKECFASMIQNGFTKEFIFVLLDYCSAISNCAHQNKTPKEGISFPLTPEPKKCVEECIHYNKQIIVRLGTAFCEVRPTQVAKTVLQKVIDAFKQEIDVIVLTSTQLNQHNLDSKPKLFLVTDQFKMGDSLPIACICVDLRERYLFPVQNFTSIIQDVGRVFGYSKRPLLLKLG